MTGLGAHANPREIVFTGKVVEWDTDEDAVISGVQGVVTIRVPSDRRDEWQVGTEVLVRLFALSTEARAGRSAA